ncbi:tRNA G18 (ribose-2'-O)-methylase SpoU [Candidatus Termititenax aidoneus]|uniref:tRNA G18 (Ribose-2'-O)-methylase SpoU n=1 Tax=Termititenax aidoneus TaxID=2218524 RepID=A0A388T8W9_TERA1|nr:tRNA G18 (ribose-2'-O)-methylase SpoU [Candidatus Termititenax aidoneus]
MLLTSPENSEIKNLRKLLSDAAYRREQKALVCEGFKILQFAKNVRTLYAREDIVLPENLQKLRHRYIAKNIFDALSSMENPQGIMTVCARPKPAKYSEKKRYIFLDRLQDPGNLGTIIRTAAAFGLDGLIYNKGCVDVFAPKVVRASMGAVFTLDLLAAEITDLTGNIIAADLYGAAPENLQINGGFVLAIGSEGQGLAAEILQRASQKVSLPIHKNKAESLNAAVAAGILLYLLQKPPKLTA